MSTEKIRDLENRIETMQAMALVTVSKLKAELQKEYNIIFNDCLDLQNAIKKLDASTRLDVDEYGEIQRVVEFNVEPFLECGEYLDNYLTEYNITRDDGISSLLKTYDGPCIIITFDGDAYDQDSRKTIVKAEQYETEEELHSLIEAWMQVKGYFPGVVKVDYHGYPIGYVQTKLLEDNQ